MNEKRRRDESNNFCLRRLFLSKHIAIGAALALSCNIPMFADNVQERVLNMSSVEGTQQQKQITGTVVDESGEPIIGASVAVVGTTTGTITDLDGKFDLSVSDNSTIKISFIGYIEQTIVVKGKSSFDIILKEDAQVLEEVVVTALGIKRQAKSIGYSTTQVKGEDFTESRDLNLGNALTGKIAGVSVSNNATGAGGSSRVVIRGNSSISGNNQPLYVIDGIPFDNTNQGSSGTYGGLDMGDGLSNISADDIESMQVLKGAAASALYGYRGGNGAILITTKSGNKNNKGVSIDINNNLTINSIYDYRDFQKTYGQGTEGGRPLVASKAQETYNKSWGDVMDGGRAVNILDNEYAYKNVDNWKEFYNTGVTNQTSASISGSADKIGYRVGLSNIFDWSIIPNAGMRQQGINLNTSYDITPKLHLNVNANYVFEKYRNRANLSDANANVNATMLYLANSYDVNFLKPGLTEDRKELQPGNNVYFNNPYFVTEQRQNTTRRNRFTGGMTLKYDITDWLYAQGGVSRDGYTLDYLLVQPTGAAQDPGGFMEEFETNFYELNANYLIGFNKKLNERFTLGATVGGNMMRNVKKKYGTDGGIGPFIIPYFYASQNVANRPYKREHKEYRVNSIYGTADIGFNDYLFLSLTGRNDWFSTLSEDDNSYFYPSVSTSFMFSDAFKMPSWVYSGKFRLAYAQASNGTEPYMTALTYGSEKFLIHNQPIGKINGDVIPNPSLKPVQIEEWEAGLNVQFLDNRLGLDLAVYRKKTTDDIVKITTSIASGYTSYITNIGEIRNQGLEAMIHGVPVNTSDFQWNTSFNIAFNDSKILYLGEGIDIIGIEGANARNGAASIKNIVGGRYGEIFGYKYATNENGERIFDKDGYAVRSDKQESLGNGVYKLTGGFRNDFKYKDFSLSFLLDYKFGAKIYSGTNSGLTGAGLHKNTLEGREAWAQSETARKAAGADLKDWTPTGGLVGKGVVNTGTATNPVWTPNTTPTDPELYWKEINSRNIDEQYVYDASFIKLRELSLGYNVPKSFLKNGIVKSLNISLVGRNLWTILKHTPNIDPESAYNNGNGQGLELNGYPTTRSYGFNVNVKF